MTVPIMVLSSKASAAVAVVEALAPDLAERWERQ